MEVGNVDPLTGDNESSKKKKDSRGRPAGSVNRDYEFTRVIPKRCAKCHCTEFVDRNVTLERNLSGIAPDKIRYNRIRWFKGRCKSCGQWNAFIEYELVSDEAAASV